MTNQKRILLVEDNEAINRINRRALEMEGYQVFTAQTLEQAGNLIEKEQPHAIILDVLLPDGNGIAFCQKIREQTAAPILFLTCMRGHQQTLEGLRAGGDDYLNKPYRLDIMVARIASFFRRDEIADKLKQPHKIVTYGSITLDMLAQRAIVHQQDMLLTPKEFSLLVFLLQNEGGIFTAEQLYEKVWKLPMKGDAHAAKNVIYRLRKKLESSNSGYEILTTRGRGYLMKRIYP